MVRASKCNDYLGTTLYHVDGVNMHIARQGDVAESKKNSGKELTPKLVNG
jgi:hypothetical protein